MRRTNFVGILIYKLIALSLPELEIVNKKENLPYRGLCRSGWPQGKKRESEKRGKNQDLARKLKKTKEQESDGSANYNWCTWHIYQMIATGTGELGNKKTSGVYSNYSIIKIG